MSTKPILAVAIGLIAISIVTATNEKPSQQSEKPSQPEGEHPTNLGETQPTPEGDSEKLQEGQTTQDGQTPEEGQQRQEGETLSKPAESEMVDEETTEVKDRFGTKFGIWESVVVASGSILVVSVGTYGVLRHLKQKKASQRVRRNLRPSPV